MIATSCAAAALAINSHHAHGYPSLRRPHLASTLTEPFQRGTERIQADHAGVGLGLAIVKSITQAHDGSLILTPRPAGGLRVTVRLPAARQRLSA